MDSASTISTCDIQKIIDKLKCRQHQDSTSKVYLSIWRKFNEFVIKLDDPPPTWEEKVSLYGGFLVAHGIQSSTFKTYVSAIKKVLVTDGYMWDDDKLILNTLFLNACKRDNDAKRSRFPIKIGLLQVILYEVERLYANNQPYLEMMYKSMFTLAYYGLLRIGELTESPHVVKAKDVYVGTMKNKIMLVLYSSKTHNKRSSPQTIKIDALDNYKMEVGSEKSFCPFYICQTYSQMRNGYLTDDEQYFVFRDHSPVKPYHVRKVLKKILRNIGLNPKLYGTHSFRIGRATDLLINKESVDHIKQLGRWKSNAVYKYLKL